MCLGLQDLGQDFNPPPLLMIDRAQTPNPNKKYLVTLFYGRRKLLALSSTIMYFGKDAKMFLSPSKIT